MAWYRTGTVSLTNGSVAVTGAGTAWIAGAAKGEGLLAPDGKIYEISSVTSDGGIQLASPYLGATVAGAAYAIVPTQSYLRDLAAQAAALVNQYADMLAGPGAGKFADGALATPGISFISDQDTGFFRSGANEVTFVAGGAAQFKYSALSGMTILSGLTAQAISCTSLRVTGGLISDANLAIGANQSAWWGGVKSIDVSTGSLFSYSAGFGPGTPLMALSNNSYVNGSLASIYKTAGPAARYHLFNGTHIWYGAPSGSAGDAISFKQYMIVDSNGNLLVGTDSGSNHTFKKTTGNFTSVLSAGAEGGISFVAAGGPSVGAASLSVASAAYLGKDTVSGRSLMGTGTFNAGGADYAEYEPNNGAQINKGQVVGFDEHGVLTLRFADARRFAIKSTDPSYVGGDCWGSPQAIGQRPEPPVFSPSAYAGQPPPEDVEAEDFALLLAQHHLDIAAYQARIETERHVFNTLTLPDYESRLADFEARLEQARQSVDRIAYSGKVPVNVWGAVPGGYIIAAEGEGGDVIGEFVADPDFEQYKRAVGRVNRILSDGRCEVAVIIH